MKRSLAPCVLTVALTALVGCGTNDSQPASNTSGEQTERIPRVTDNSGRPAVVFDPCLDVPDDVISQAGYVPESKKQSDYPLDDYTFLGCDFDTPVRQYGLSLLSGNVTFEEEKEKTAAFAKPINVNGRDGLLKLDPTLVDACAVTLETDYGILIIVRDLYSSHIGPAPQEEWCAGLEDTAGLIEPLLPKE